MPKSKPHVMVVDDSPEDILLLLNLLRGDYRVSAATSGEECMQRILETPVDVIVLDVNMPGKDGYEICRDLRARYKHLQILFLSANSGIDEILKGYDAGGNDYITKPYLAEIMLSKIACAIATAKKLAHLEQEKHFASAAFMSAVSSMGDLGGIIRFLRGCFDVSQYDELAKLLIDCLQNHDLHTCFQLRAPTGAMNYATSGEVSPLELELLNRIAQTPDRFLENRNRLFVNFENVSALIKNMPADDDLKQGRLRDTLAILMEATNEKQSSLLRQEGSLPNIPDTIFLETEGVGQMVKNMLQELRHANVNLTDNLADQLHNSFEALSLSDTQEDTIAELLQQGKQAALQLFNYSVQLEEGLADVIHRRSM